MPNIFGSQILIETFLTNEDIFLPKFFLDPTFFTLIFWAQNISGQMMVKCFDIKSESTNQNALENGV